MPAVRACTYHSLLLPFLAASCIAARLLTWIAMAKHTPYPSPRHAHDLLRTASQSNQLIFIFTQFVSQNRRWR